MQLSDALLVVGATARLTRFITRDDLGHWTVKGPAERTAMRSALARHSHLRAAEGGDTRIAVVVADWDADDPDTWPLPLKATSGLTCPWCVSPWLALGVLGSYGLARLSGQRALLTAWRGVAGALSASFVVGATLSAMEPEDDD